MIIQSKPHYYFSKIKNLLSHFHLYFICFNNVLCKSSAGVITVQLQKTHFVPDTFFLSFPPETSDSFCFSDCIPCVYMFLAKRSILCEIVTFFQVIIAPNIVFAHLSTNVDIRQVSNKPTYFSCRGDSSAHLVEIELD